MARWVRILMRGKRQLLNHGEGVFKNLPKKLEEISDALGGLVLDGVDTANAASDAIDGVLVSSAIDPIASHLGGILDGLDPKGDINGWVDTIMGGFGAAMGTDGFKEGLESILSNSFLGNFSDETMDTVRDLLKNGVRDSSLAGAVKNMLDSRLSSQIMIGLNRGFFWGGIVTDSMNWLGKGDSLLSTIVRSVGNGYLMDALGSHCPSLGVMELVNFVGFGGQPAADIISPTKTITGATNLLYDMIKDNINGTNNAMERLAAGDYGPNMKNFVDGAVIGIDAVKDPDRFINDWNSIVQIDEANGDIYTDMHNTVEELFKLPPGTSEYSPRRLGSFIGRNTFNGIVAGAEGAARLGQAVGDFVGSNRYVDSAVTAASDAAAAAADAAASVGNAAYQAGGYLASGAKDAASSAWNYAASWF